MFRSASYCVHRRYVLLVLFCAAKGCKENQTSYQVPKDTIVSKDSVKSGVTPTGYVHLWNIMDISDISLCLWEKLYHIDSHRIARVVKYAKCPERSCNYSFAQLHRKNTFHLRHRFECFPFTKDILVYEHGRSQLLTDVPVACICVRRDTFYPQYFRVFAADEPIRDSYDYASDSAQENIGGHSDRVLSNKYDHTETFNEYMSRKKSEDSESLNITEIAKD